MVMDKAFLYKEFQGPSCGKFLVNCRTEANWAARQEAWVPEVTTVIQLCQSGTHLYTKETTKHIIIPTNHLHLMRRGNLS